MNRPYVTTLKRIEKRELMVDENAFEFRPRLGWVWLQKLCFAILAWIGAYREHYVETVTYGPLDNEKLNKAVFTLIEEACGWRRYPHGPYTVLMGKKQFHELVCDKEMHELFMWSNRYEVGRNDVETMTRSFEIHGVNFVAAPWLDGMALVPGRFVEAR